MSYAWAGIRTNQASSASGWSEAQKQNNALIINDYFHTLNGWTVNAVAGMLGNMEVESYINPGQTEIGYPVQTTSGGFGLVQWTPRTKYSDWAGADWETNFDKQLQRILYEYNGGYEQWNSARVGGVTFAQWARTTNTPAWACDIFQRAYEQPQTITDRSALANKWYQYLTGETPPVPVTGNLPVWLLFKIRWDGGTRRK